MHAQPSSEVDELELVPTIPRQVETPAEPRFPELIRAAEILRQRGTIAGTFGRPGDRRCLIGAILEAQGCYDRLPPSGFEEANRELLGALLDALPPLPGCPPARTLEGYSDDCCRVASSPHRYMAAICDRVAWGI